MNVSTQKIGLTLASLTVVVAVGGFFVADGYMTGQRTASLAAAVLPVEVVYVRPAPPAEVINVAQAAPSLPPKVVHVTVAGSGDEND